MMIVFPVSLPPHPNGRDNLIFVEYVIIGVKEDMKRNGGGSLFDSARDTTSWDGLIWVYCRSNILFLFIDTVTH